MSSAYIQRLRSVQSEYDAVKMSINFFEQHQRRDQPQQIGALTPRDFVRAELNLEATYFIRLYAEFEGVLKDHLATNHRRVRIPEKPRVDWLLSRVLQTEALSLESPLRARLDAVRDYCNSVTHRTRRAIERAGPSCGFFLRCSFCLEYFSRPAARAAGVIFQ